MKELVCRILVDPDPNSGPWNMAVDEALLESAVNHGWWSVRVYQWAQPTVSLGYFQRFADRDPKLRDLPVVRRLTGGGAILHHRELTYSCCLPAQHPLARQPNRIYEEVHRAVLDWLAEYGVCARFRGRPLPGQTGFLCFGRGDPNDLLLDGHKILGSAQRRRRGAVLQHGSLLLERSPHATAFPGLLDLRAGLRLRERSENELAELIAGRLCELAKSERSGEQVAVQLEREATLTDRERQLTRRLCRERYGSSSWTAKF